MEPAQEVHQGGCLCGAVRYRIGGNPVRSGACHCTFCQRRTGTAFAIYAHFPASGFEITGPDLLAYTHRSDGSGREMTMHSCPVCATTVYLTMELFPDAVSIQGGTFDDPDWLPVNTHIWTGSGLKWVGIPATATAHRGAPR